jgi:lambda family phage portal protein
MNPLQRIAAKILRIPTEQPVKKRAYSGAARQGVSVSGWLAMGTSADAEIWSSLATLRARAWDVHRNDANVHGAIEMIVSQVIDKGLMIQPKVKMSRGKGLNTRVNQEIIDKFERWATNKAWCDTSGKHTFYKAQKTILRSLIVSGEVLVRIVKQPFADSPIPFALEIIEPDQLDDRQNSRMANGNEVRMGVEVDQWRRPVAYHILPCHPGDVGFRTQSYSPVRVPADEILHLWNWRGVRPGQTRGVSALASIIIESRNLLGYKESEQVKARIQSCIMGHYQREYPDVEPMETDEEGYRVFTMEPGIIEDLPPGVTFNGFDPSSPNPNFKDFLLQGQRGMAQGMGVASYTVTGDLSDANYSSMRTGMLGERKNYEQLRDDLAEDLISPIYRQFLDIGVLSGFLKLPRDYETRRDFYSVHEVAGSPWAWIDPFKDMQANQLALESGLTTKTRLLKEQGIEFEDICAELSEEKAIAERYGVSFEPIPSPPALDSGDEPKLIAAAIDDESPPSFPDSGVTEEKAIAPPKRIPRKQKKRMAKWK